MIAGYMKKADSASLLVRGGFFIYRSARSAPSFSREKQQHHPKRSGRRTNADRLLNADNAKFLEFQEPFFKKVLG